MMSEGRETDGSKNRGHTRCMLSNEASRWHSCETLRRHEQRWQRGHHPLGAFEKASMLVFDEVNSSSKHRGPGLADSALGDEQLLGRRMLEAVVLAEPFLELANDYSAPSQLSRME